MLKEHIGSNDVVTVIGLCKNSGKTTVLRQLMTELSDETLALTSVGRDGESTDLTTGTEKPALYIKSGDFFATAHGMLPLCDSTCSVEAFTDIATPLGEVVVLRALSDGYIQLAGPSASGQLHSLNDTFFRLGAQRVLIDGAAGRKSLASAGASGCTILCVGASYDSDMASVVSEAAHICSLFALQPPKFPVALGNVSDHFLLYSPEGELLPLYTDDAGIPLWQKLPKIPCVLWVSGAVTEPMIKSMAQRGSPVTIVTQDATHILASRESLDAFRQMGGSLAVRQPLTIAAVCANPWSAYGWNFPADEFTHTLREAIPLPIINVLEGCL